MSDFQFFLIQEEAMAFGLAVADYNIDTGTYGKIIKVDVATYLPHLINLVQGESGSNIKSSSITTPVTLPVLQDYLEDSDCPNIAYNLGSEILTIFFKNDVYDTRFSFGGKRKSQKLVNDSDLLDVKNERLPLLSLYARDFAYLALKKRSDEDILEQIEELEFDIRV